jgi:hypothetical protein
MPINHDSPLKMKKGKKERDYLEGWEKGYASKEIGGKKEKQGKERAIMQIMAFNAYSMCPSDQDLLQLEFNWRISCWGILAINEI